VWAQGLTALAILSASCGRIGYEAVALAGTDADPNAMDADPNAIDAAPGADANDVTAGLVARYTFDVDVGSEFLGLHDATCVPSCPARDTSGYQGAALDMVGGSDHLVVADGNAFDQSSGFTLSSWVRYRDYSSRSCLFTKPVGGGGSNSWALCTDAGGTPFFYSCETCDFLSASQTIALDTWVHLAASFDGTTKIIYVDGAMVNQVDGAVTFDASDIVIGGDNDGSFGFATDGLIDEIRIYDRALSSTEIATLAGL
jgi:hypothetical protein